MPGGYTTHTQKCAEYAAAAEDVCRNLECGACVQVDDGQCNFADGKCYPQGLEPMTATSFAFTLQDCSPFEAIVDGTCAQNGMDSIVREDDCKEALLYAEKSETWEKQTSSSSMTAGCFTSSKTDKSYYVYDKPSRTYAMSDPDSKVSAGTTPRKSASSKYTYYCHKADSRSSSRSAVFNTVSSQGFAAEDLIVYGFAAIGVAFLVAGARRLVLKRGESYSNIPESQVL